MKYKKNIQKMKFLWIKTEIKLWYCEQILGRKNLLNGLTYKNVSL